MPTTIIQTGGTNVWSYVILITIILIALIALGIALYYILIYASTFFGGCDANEQNKTPIGESCARDCQCKNNACGRLTAADGAELKCCPSGATYRYPHGVLQAGYDYCTEMPDGSVCWADDMCASRNCQNNQGGTQKGICSGLPDGAKCNVNARCRNHACGRPSASDSDDNNLICCPSGDEVRAPNLKDYCTRMPDGNECYLDSMCESGLCRGNNNGTQKGICSQKGDVGSSCTFNSDCINKACGRTLNDQGFATDPTCCMSGQTVTWGTLESPPLPPLDYCTQMPSGSKCGLDSMCASGNCRGNSFGIKRGICD